MSCKQLCGEGQDGSGESKFNTSQKHASGAKYSPCAALERHYLQLKGDHSSCTFSPGKTYLNALSCAGLQGHTRKSPVKGQKDD